jgi:hypothetical protein
MGSLVKHGYVGMIHYKGVLCMRGDTIKVRNQGLRNPKRHTISLVNVQHTLGHTVQEVDFVNGQIHRSGSLTSQRVLRDRINIGSIQLSTTTVLSNYYATEVIDSFKSWKH